MTQKENIGDSRSGINYLPDPGAELAAQVALCTNRPLLVCGEPGSGKSALAGYLARIYNWKYYEYVFTARSEAVDLLWKNDLVRRLADAQANKVQPDRRYLSPGALWWSLSPTLARELGRTEPYQEINASRRGGSVVLLDEIDKANPNVPNDLLVPLGCSTFVVDCVFDEEIQVAAAEPEGEAPQGHKQTWSRRLVLITTNEETQLPAAFLRRCITFRTTAPDKAKFLSVAKLHYNTFCEENPTLMDQIIDKFISQRASVQERKPSLAEFVDAIRACIQMDITDLDSKEWQVVERVVIKKEDV